MHTNSVQNPCKYVGGVSHNLGLSATYFHSLLETDAHRAQSGQHVSNKSFTTSPLAPLSRRSSTSAANFQGCPNKLLKRKWNQHAPTKHARRKRRAKSGYSAIHSDNVKRSVNKRSRDGRGCSNKCAQYCSVTCTGENFLVTKSHNRGLSKSDFRTARAPARMNCAVRNLDGSLHRAMINRTYVVVI